MARPIIYPTLYGEVIEGPPGPPGPQGPAGEPGASVVPVTETAPLDPSNGQLWWDSAEGYLYVWYDDGTSAQWVIAVPSAGVETEPGTSVVVSATEPLDPAEGDLWWNTVSQSLFVFNAEWVEVSGSGGGASVLVSLTPPVDPTEGDLWWDTDSGNLFVWYDDGDSQQWVIAIQVTDGQSIVPVADYISYTSGPQTFTISDIPYNS